MHRQHVPAGKHGLLNKNDSIDELSLCATLLLGSRQRDPGHVGRNPGRVDVLSLLRGASVLMLEHLREGTQFGLEEPRVEHLEVGAALEDDALTDHAQLIEEFNDIRAVSATGRGRVPSRTEANDFRRVLCKRQLLRLLQCLQQAGACLSIW